MVGDAIPHVNAAVCNTFISFYLENTYPTATICPAHSLFYLSQLC